MFHILIDTGIYRGHPGKNNFWFQMLDQMITTEDLKIYLPYYVEKEHLTQMQAKYLKNFDKIELNLVSLKNKTSWPGLEEKVESIQKKLLALNYEYMAAVEKDLDTWVRKAGAERVEICDTHGSKVSESYFKGTGVFGGRKSRKDIPDAFIWEAAKDIRSKSENLYLITEDQGFERGNLQELGIVLCKSLEEFFHHDDVKEVFDTALGLENIQKIIECLSNKPELLKDRLEDPLSVELGGEQYQGIAEYDDNGEGTIDSLGIVSGHTSLSLDFAHGGPDDEEIYFSFTVKKAEGLIDYYIYQSDWNFLEEEQQKGISVSDWNDHYYSAQEYLDIDISGGLTIQINSEILKKKDLSEGELENLIKGAEIIIEEIDDVTLSDSEL